MSIKLFFGLGIFWAVFGIQQFWALAGDPSRGRVVTQFMGMAAMNLLVAWFLAWLRERRQRSGS